MGFANGVIIPSLLCFVGFAASLPAIKPTTSSTTEDAPVTRGDISRQIQMGNLSVTTHMVKSPKSIYVINKMIFLTPNSLIQVKPQDILVMSRPYGPAKVYYWLTNTHPGSGSRRALLYNSTVDQLLVVLWKKNIVRLFYETSEFEITAKSEGGGGGSGGSGSGGSRGGSGVDGKSDSSVQAAGDSFNFLSVQLRKTKPKMVEAVVDRLSKSAPSRPAPPNASHPGHPFGQIKPGITYWQEVKLFFANVARLVHLSAQYVNSCRITKYIYGFLEIYRPHFGTQE